jgi:hypothetical protein
MIIITNICFRSPWMWRGIIPYIDTWSRVASRWKKLVSTECCYISTKLNDVISQTAVTLIIPAVRITNTLMVMTWDYIQQNLNKRRSVLVDNMRKNGSLNLYTVNLNLLLIWDTDYRLSGERYKWFAVFLQRLQYAELRSVYDWKTSTL